MKEKVTSRKRYTAVGSAVFLTLAILLSFLPQAFADFSTEGSMKVLGVGRIQSAKTSTVPAATQERFAASNNPSGATAEASTVEQLTTPLERNLQTTKNTASEDAAGSVTNGGWQTCRASAYGPSNAGRWTASGTELTDDSCGVAVDISMGRFLGRTVEIEYGGMTIRATVVDTGNLYANGRGLDLQPGVWKAFGASDENSWGVRTVSWRFAD